MTGSEKKIIIDVISVPFSGHLLPTLTLVLPLLEDSRFQIRVFTGAQKKDLVEGLGFDCWAFFPESPTVMEDIANTPRKNNLLSSFRQLKANASLIPQVVSEIERMWQEEGEPDLVIADFVAVPAGLIANQHSLPWITTIPSPFAVEAQSGTPSYMGGWKPHQGMLYQIRDFLGRKAIHFGKSLAFSLVKNRLGAYKNFALYRKDGSEAIYSPYSILALGMREIEFRDDFPKQLRWVGYKCQSFDSLPQKHEMYFLTSKKKVLITCGTHLKWEKGRMIQQAQKLCQHYPNFQFYVTLGEVEGLMNSPRKLAENLLIFDYLPYSDILGQMDFVIHHAGAGIMMSCVEREIPSLLLPKDYDQPDFAARAELAQIGLVARKQTDTEVLRLFEEMLQRTDWSQLKELAQKSRSYSQTEILYQEIERLLKNSIGGGEIISKGQKNALEI